ncbi:MAG: GntP family permease [Chitinophagaceae bacterium]|nr:GntP family permease [Chitinophagaceae bacterium]
MQPSLYLVLFCLLIGIVAIVLLTTRFRLHPFFALLIASLLVGTGVGLPVGDVVNFVKEGFGNIMRSLGLIIVLGTALGAVLEKTGSTRKMAGFLMRTIGKKYPAMAMGITGFIVGMPLFCDSGFIVLSGLNASFARKTNMPVVVLAVAMATGLYSVHCLIPPHPGAAAAASTLGVDYGKLILAGILVAIPAMLIGNIYARYAGMKMAATTDHPDTVDEPIAADGPGVLHSFLPVIVPVLLIAARSFLAIEKNGKANSILLVLGDPVVALAIGLLLAITLITKKNRNGLTGWLQEGAEKAGGILVIIGAGGGFGAVLNATKIGPLFSEALPLAGMGLLFPFLLCFVLKTAQGSSTVAIITGASIIQPLLPALGFTSPDGKLLCVLAMGAGSMMISHANDAYFWVISRFEKIGMKEMLRVYSIATILMGLISLATIYLFSFLL